MIDKIIKKLENKKICILGFGIEGRSTYLFIRKYLHNQEIAIRDMKDICNDKLFENDKNVKFMVGDNYLEGLEEYDIIIKTPGISFKNLDICNIRNKITSQLELLLEVNRENVIGVTGTKGKSTTSSLIYEQLKNNGIDVYLVGNIGNPILDNIEKFTDKTKLVIEMSSHQLEFINISPHIGVILNLYEDHLDHAGSVKHYHECKLNMFKYMDKSDISIYCSDNVILNKYIKENKYLSKKISVSLTDSSDTYLIDNIVFYNGKKIYDTTLNRNLIGRHNLENIMVSLTISELLGLDLQKSIEAINRFKTLEHRLELVGTFDGITYYDDCIATIPEATISAIESLKDVNTLIFGGMDRGIDYSNFIKFLNKCDVKNIICMPSTGYKIGKQIESKNVYYAQTLKEAVNIAKNVTDMGKICLLSPAASSYEYYKSFKEKGEEFKRLVGNI